MPFKDRARHRRWERQNPGRHSPERRVYMAARKAEYARRPDSKYKLYKRSAAKREVFWGLSEEQFMSFWQQPCTYCGRPIDTIGLDRVDNALGYTLENVQPCCSICNKMKSTYPEDWFVAHCRLITSRSSS